jgi:hypothetical protein
LRVQTLASCAIGISCANIVGRSGSINRITLFSAKLNRCGKQREFVCEIAHYNCACLDAGKRLPDAFASGAGNLCNRFRRATRQSMIDGAQTLVISRLAT